MFKIYTAFLAYDLKSVDKTADTPRPCRIVTHLDVIRVKSVKRFLATFLGMLHYFPEREAYHRDVSFLEDLLRKAACSPSDADDGRERTFSFRILDVRMDCQGLSVHGYINDERISAHSCLDTFARSLRLPSDLIILEFGHDLCTTALPLGIFFNLVFPVREHERIGKSLDYRKFIDARHFRGRIRRSCVFLVEYKGNLLGRIARSEKTDSKKNGQNRFR